MNTTLLELVTLEDAARLPVDAVGGKAARLAALRARGFPVPDGFVLTTAVHQRALRKAQTGRASRAKLPEELRPAFVAACERLGYPLIVRSSAVAEDLAGASFAGQFESVLHVWSEDAAIAAVEHCWEAATSAHVAEYRRAHQATDGGLALLVQRQLEPASAGVAFGRDPLTGEDRVVIEAVPGLADRLLDGTVSPERWTVTHDEPRRDSRSGGAPALNPEQALAIAAMVGRLGEIFTAPQDVEWAIVGSELNALQSRPITTLHAAAVTRPQSRPAVPAGWLRDSLHWPDRLSPLGADYWAKTTSASLAEACDAFGLLIGTMKLHLVEYRVYGEVLPFGASKLPPPPPWMLPILIRIVPPLRKRIARAVEVVRTDLAGEILERWIAADAPRLSAELTARRAVNLTALDSGGLCEHLDDTIAFLGRCATAHYMALFAVSQAVAEYAFLSRDLFGWDTVRALSELNPRSTASTDAALALDEVAKHFVTDPAQAIELHLPDVTAVLAGDTETSAILHGYLDRYGGRMLGLDPMDATLAEAPEALGPALEAAIARVDASSVPAELSAGVTTASIPNEPVAPDIAAADRARWRRAASRASRYYGIRDESELLGVGEPLGLLRRVALEFGRRLATRDLIVNADDCFMLTVDELRGAVLGADDLRDVVSARRREFDAAALVPDAVGTGTLPAPPDLSALPEEARFANAALLWYLGSILGENRREVPSGAIVGGMPVSPGRHRGPVRVVRGSQDFHRVRQGDVLVCPTTAPSWSPILAQVGAVVADHGGMLSHPAIIAREFGIPAIVGTMDGTGKLRDGEIVVVDGSAGSVSRWS